MHLGKKQLIALAMGSVAFGAAGTGRALAGAVLYNSNGFESSAGYVAGNNLDGQPTGIASNKWEQSGSTATNPPYPYAGVITYSSSTQQLVGVADSNIGNSDYGSWYPATYVTSPFTPVAAVTDHVQVSWTEAWTASTGDPFFGIQVFNGNSSVALAGVDASNSLLVVENSTNTSELGSNFFQGSAGTYYNFMMDMNYSTQHYGIYVNGALVDTEPFATSASQFTDADITTYVLGSSGANGTGYFDNYLVQAVPEPSALTFIAPASLLLLGRYRGKKCPLLAENV